MRIFSQILLVAALLSGGGRLEAQSFKVLVLDAVSGKPQAKMQVHYFCTAAMHNYLPGDEDDTDDDGVVIIPYRCQGKEAKIQIAVAGLPKEECGGEPDISFDEIMSKGLINAPDAAGQMQCTTKISGKLKPVPGQVIIFVKKPNWFQSHF